MSLAGAATRAQLSAPKDVAVDQSGNLFVADAFNNRVREVVASTGVITTVAGTGTAGYSGDGGAPRAARLNSPAGVAVDQSGNLFMADTSNNRIREVVAATGLITTVAGTGTAGFGGDGGPATQAALNSPHRVALDGAGDLLLADSSNNRVREVVAATGVMTTVAGTGTAGFSGDGGAATAAQLDNVQGLALDPAGNLFVADTYNNRVREVIASTGIITTVAGGSTQGFSGEGGPAPQAALSRPQGLVLDAAGDLFVADADNSRVRVVGQVGSSVPSSATTTLRYDPAHPGDVLAKTDPAGHVSTYAYDQYGDLVRAGDPLSETATYSYDPVGRLTSMVSPKGNVAGANPISYTTGITYDAFGDTTAITDPLAHATTYQYDANGNLVAATEALTHTTRYGYDADDEQTTITQTDGSVLRTGYDAAGNVISQTNGLTETTRYAYDPLDRVITMTDPLTRTTVYTHDLAGNLTALTDALNRTTSYAYDPANELTGITYALTSTPTVAFTYTADGQRATMTDGTGTTTYTYDSLQRLVRSVNGAGHGVGYGYDPAGHLITLSYPDGSGVTRTYDPAGRLTTVGDSLGHTTRFAYDADGNAITQTYPASATAGFSYNAADQLTQIADQYTGGQWTFGYGRDGLGQLASATDPLENLQHSYGYDTLNRLTGDQRSNGSTTWSNDAGPAMFSSGPDWPVSRLDASGGIPMASP